MSSKLLLCILLSVIGFRAASAQQQPHVLKSETTQKVRLPYLLHIPTQYNEDPQKRWPFILYLHGGSARGDDLEKLKTMGLPKRLEHDREFPFVVASPLLSEGEIWTDVGALGALVDQVARLHRVDASRIYVTGHSMGGRGSLYAAYKQPGRFAAVAALSPYSPITAWSKNLTHVPLWVIHGAKDAQAPIKDSEELVQAIEKAGGKPRFSPLPEADHFILDWYDKNEVFDWLLEQRRGEGATTEAAG